MDEPLFNELLESVKQADQIMTDHAELRRLAKAATPGPWEYQAPLKILAADRTSIVLIALSHANYREDEANSRLIAAANPKTILALLDEIDRLSDELSACTEHPGGCGYWREAAKRRAEERDRLRAENDRLRQGMKGDYDIDAWLDWSKEKEQIKAQNDALQGALHAVQAEVDGNLRPLTRDLVNMVSGLNNGTHPNDIYEHCDEIERIIGAALEGAKP
ncbi:TPA: ead/Ea22-like family protein [Pseudomonas aeruginosa]|nr:ead/Ea22-like family protein [Pseudomonas aeruginosa]HCL4260881.1 ead/Ea22-like family protein [Pseudomonas aeruginosa]HEJ3968343.1 ead/Ea22-like family protein [Pseudomonas aeruginosa]HEJ6552139.1 ead/Ea22-like family protein [Pseudomonas aeruginosa]